MATLKLLRASQIVDASLEKGQRMGAAPLTVVFLDGGGRHMKVILDHAA